jgi:anion-transporting  ArsA/GET3 family ATPase
VKELLKKGSIVIMLGTGGVGKTTLAAALGLAGAMSNLNTAVITVDPARRLRDALGLDHLGGKPTRLNGARLARAGLNPSLELSAMVLDVKGTWDALVERFVGDPSARRRILENSFYRSLTEQFAGSDAYAALEKLHDLHDAGGFAFQIVDTPPADHAFEFIQAPAHLIQFLNSRAGRWLFTPYLTAGRAAMKLLGRVTQFIFSELERFAGFGVLSAVAEFFAAAAGAVDSISDRFRKTQALLHSRAVHFVMVTTAEEDRLREARGLVDDIESEGLHLDAIVINRFLDERSWRALILDPGKPIEQLEEIAKLRAALDPELAADQRLGAIVEYLEGYDAQVCEEIRRVRRFARDLPARVRLALVPDIGAGVGDLSGLRRIADALTQAEADRSALAAPTVRPAVPKRRLASLVKGA